ncbi:MAG TPA: HEAT repeat domain-containing protein, partial [Kofleriaceae bacterium]|nr:HEAT repeat domain-containing protein [Kofleriaceae bacterium]
MAGCRIARLIAPMLDDADPAVRRRAAYAAGNLGLAELAPALARRCADDEPAELRLAAYVALGELGMPGVVAEVVAQIRREDDPRVLGAASNALLAAAPDAAALAGLGPRASQLLGAPDARLREAGAEIAGLLGGAVPARALTGLVGDPAPAVRGAAVWALGKLADPATEAALLAAFRDDD